MSLYYILHITAQLRVFSVLSFSHGAAKKKEPPVAFLFLGGPLAESTGCCLRGPREIQIQSPGSGPIS
jgi:hypothetical protein